MFNSHESKCSFVRTKRQIHHLAFSTSSTLKIYLLLQLIKRVCCDLFLGQITNDPNITTSILQETFGKSSGDYWKH